MFSKKITKEEAKRNKKETRKEKQEERIREKKGKEFFCLCVKN